MKRLILLLLITTSAFGQSATATIQFSGTPIGAIITVNPNGFVPEIQGIEVTQQVGACSGASLQAQITSASTSIPLTVPSGCTVLPGMGIALGCAAGGGSCTSVSTIKAAGCSGTPLSCPVVQGQLGTTPVTYASGVAVTILKGGDGNNFLCGAMLTILQTLAQLGAATVNNPAVPAAASTAVATQNTAITTAVGTINSTIAGAFSCTPTQ
jgi:hypothetical protein